MPLASGIKIGAYEVLSPLGAGGMGEVYRARDARLSRDVAIKALPPEFAQDPERLARFEREARLLASLSHPNIAGIFGVEEDHGSRYLVLEFVEGESLAERIARGPLPLDDALDVGREVATGLEAAHESGVVHRDLKPGNVMLTPSGGVKLLDFGLAKSEASDRPGSMPDIASSPTMTHARTQAGIILGTAAYMSPEQARGKPVDKRSDIWSFGCVLYECLTGRQLFKGETVSDLIAKILQTEPDWSALPAATPGRVRALLQRCLTRDPRVRLRDIGEARVALSATGDAAEPALPGAQPVRPGRSGVPGWAALVGALALAAIVGFIALRAGMSSAPAPVRRLDLAATDIDQEWFITPILSPDGRHIAYTGKGHVWVRDLDRLAPRAVADVSGASPLSWSPDSRTILYRDQATLYKVGAQGGDPTALCAIPGTGSILGTAWGTNGTIAFSVWRGGIYQVHAGGGDASLLFPTDPATTVDYHAPTWLSNGDLLYVTHWKQPRDSTGKWLANLTVFDGKKQVRVSGDIGTDDEASPHMTKDGELLFLRGGTNEGIWAVPFDLGRRRIAGTPYLVAPGAASISLSEDGSLLYMEGRATATNELAWLDRAGKVIEELGQSHPHLLRPRLSPDGRRVAFDAEADGHQEIWVRDLSRGTDTRLTFGDENKIAPEWLPSGTRIVYTEPQGIQGRILSVTADGSGEPKEIAPLEPQGSMALDVTSLVVAPDGRLALRVVSEGGHSRLRMGPVLPDGVLGRVEPLMRIRPEPDLGQPAIAPDGRLLAYVTDNPGKPAVFLTRFPSADGKWEVGTDGGRSPRWARATGELFYLAGVGAAYRSLVMAAVHSGQDPPLGAITKLFDLDADLEGQFDVSPDGQRFLFSRHVRSDSDAARRMVLVENWRAEFKK
jgi:eukaryotic-like serine/threonine-protein kinase